MATKLATHYFSTRPCAFCQAVDGEVIKALGTMVWISMPESVEEKCYGCTGVTDKEGRHKFFGSQRDHDVCCMMTSDEQVDYISEDVIRKIITTPELSEELWKRVEVGLKGHERKQLQQILNNAKPEDRTVDENWAINENLDKITDYTKFLLKSSPCFLTYTIKKHPYSRGRGMSTQTNKKRFTFDRRNLTIDPVPTILYYKDTNINDSTVKLNYCYKENVVINKLLPLSVTDWNWNGCNLCLK